MMKTELRYRFAISFLLAILTSCSKSPAERFPALHHAAKAIEGACRIGVNHDEFRKLLQNFSTELEVAKSSAVTRDQKAISAYSDALSVYRDSLTLWDKQIELAPTTIEAEREAADLISKGFSGSSRLVVSSTEYAEMSRSGGIPMKATELAKDTIVVKAIEEHAPPTAIVAKYQLALVDKQAASWLPGSSLQVLWDKAASHIANKD